MADITLTTEVSEILQTSQIDNNVLILPGQISDRKLYLAVNKALTNAGGIWNRKAGGHVFEGNIREKLAGILSSGRSVDEKKAFQAFYTPPSVARLVAEIADVEGHDVLEPSAGRAALADACLSAQATSVLCVELNPESAAFLRTRGFAVDECDFLRWSAAGRSFSRIVMNPPFCKNQDVAHVSHALKCLAPGGRLVSIMFGNEERKPFQALLQNVNHSLTHLERGQFASSGTEIPTILLTIDK